MMIGMIILRHFLISVPERPLVFLSYFGDWILHFRHSSLPSPSGMMIGMIILRHFLISVPERPPTKMKCNI